MAVRLVEKVLLKVSPMKGMMRLRNKEKPCLIFIRPFEILKKVGDTAYTLALPPNLLIVHPMFNM